MAKIDWDKFPSIPGFSAVGMKREIQARIYEKTKDMTPQEHLEYLHKSAEEFWAEEDCRRAEKKASQQEKAVS